MVTVPVWAIGPVGVTAVSEAKRPCAAIVAGFSVVAATPVDLAANYQQ